MIAGADQPTGTSDERADQQAASDHDCCPPEGQDTTVCDVLGEQPHRKRRPPSPRRWSASRVATVAGVAGRPRRRVTNSHWPMVTARNRRRSDLDGRWRRSFARPALGHATARRPRRAGRSAITHPASGELRTAVEQPTSGQQGGDDADALGERPTAVAMSVSRQAAAERRCRQAIPTPLNKPSTTNAIRMTSGSIASARPRPPATPSTIRSSERAHRWSWGGPPRELVVEARAGSVSRLRHVMHGTAAPPVDAIGDHPGRTLRSVAAVSG